MVINLYGGPGSGKSTFAALLFSELKLNGVNCELVTEFAKQLVWQERQTTLKNQIYVFGKQLEKMIMCHDKVDCIITDSPLLLSMLYNIRFSKTFDKLVQEVHHSFPNVNYFINRTKEYNHIGRLQTKTEAIEIDNDNKRLLNMLEIPYTEIVCTKESAEKIANNIIKAIK